MRLDSGNDAAENVGIMLENGAYYVIKRNIRRESKDEWAEKIKSWCKDVRCPREGKTVYVGSTFNDIDYTTENGEQKTICNRIVYEMTERTSAPDGQMFLIPEYELNMFWTNLGDSDDEIIITPTASVSSFIVKSRQIWALNGSRQENSILMSWYLSLH